MSFALCPGWFDELGVLVFVHFLCFLALAVLESPEQVRSVGVHEPTGNCSEISPVQTAIGQVRPLNLVQT